MHSGIGGLETRCGQLLAIAESCQWVSPLFTWTPPLFCFLQKTQKCSHMHTGSKKVFEHTWTLFLCLCIWGSSHVCHSMYQSAGLRHDAWFSDNRAPAAEIMEYFLRTCFRYSSQLSHYCFHGDRKFENLCGRGWKSSKSTKPRCEQGTSKATDLTPHCSPTIIFSKILTLTSSCCQSFLCL